MSVEDVDIEPEPITTLNVPRLTPKELNELARDVYSGQVWIEVNFDRDTLMTFMPLALGVFAGLPEWEMQKIGGLYEHMHKAGPMGHNGKPIFYSVNVLHINDLPRLRTRVDEIHTAMESVAPTDG